MTLNNGGDVISLIDAAGVVRDRFEYGASSEGVAIATGIRPAQDSLDDLRGQEQCLKSTSYKPSRDRHMMGHLPHLSRLWMRTSVTILAFGIWTQHAVASVVTPMPPSRLTERAGVIFAGTVRSALPERLQGTIVTRVVFESLRFAKGHRAGNTLSLLLEGGTIQNEHILVSGQPTFEPGKRYIVFAHSHLGFEGRNFTPVVGLYQGYFPVQIDKKSGKSQVLDKLNRPVVRITPERLTVVLPDTMIAPRRREIDNARGAQDSVRIGVPPTTYRGVLEVVRERADTGVRLTEDEFLNAVVQLQK